MPRHFFGRVIHVRTYVRTHTQKDLKETENLYFEQMCFYFFSLLKIHTHAHCLLRYIGPSEKRRRTMSTVRIVYGRQSSLSLSLSLTLLHVHKCEYGDMTVNAKQRRIDWPCLLTRLGPTPTGFLSCLMGKSILASQSLSQNLAEEIKKEIF